MAEFMTEEEQIIAIKVWWKRYGVFILGGVVVGLIIYFGWSAWQSHNLSLRAQASNNYQALAENLMAGNTQATEQQIAKTENAKLPMPYDLMEKWLVAQVAVEQQKWDEAISHLQQALLVGTDPFAQELTSVRLARVYLAQDKPEQALGVLTLKNDKLAVTNPEVLVAKGDAYAALNDIENARKEYTQAWALYPAYNPQRQVIAMLLADLPAQASAPVETK